MTIRNNLLLMICNENVAYITFSCENVKTSCCRHNIFTAAEVSIFYNSN